MSLLPFNWMYGFGNQFPYTNFHELNMDWIIAICKDLATKFPQMVTEMTKKLNSPTDMGEVGDFLINVGNGKTKWENMETRFVPVIVTAVDNWLSEHPEATTTVQDGTITYAKLSEDIKVLVDGYKVIKTLTGITNYEQDATAYEGKIFEIGSDSGVLKVFDTVADDYIATTQLAGGIRPHGNAISFGRKMNDNDVYPLLYVTGYNGYDANNQPLPRGTCFVYRIENDFSTALIQSINIDFIASQLWMGDSVDEDAVHYGNFIADPDNNKLYVFTTLKENEVAKTRLFIFNMPSYYSPSVTLYEADIQEYYDLPFYPYLQGAEYYDGKLYISYGMSRLNSGLAVIDLTTKEQIGNVFLGENMFEPEAVIHLGNDIYVAQYGFLKLSVVPCETNIGNLSKLKTLRNNTIVDAINSLVPTNDNFYSQVTNAPDMQYGSFTKRLGMVNLSYQGKSATHEADQVLFTLPEGYRPRGFQFVPAIKGNYPILLRIDETTGQCAIWNASSDALNTTSRIYFDTFYICK